MGNREEEHHSMSSSHRPPLKNADESSVLGKMLRAGYVFDYGITHTGVSLLNALSDT